MPRKKTARSRSVRAPERVRFRSAPATRRRDAKRSILWDFEAAGLGSEFDLLGRAQRLLENVVTGETETNEGLNRSDFVMPMAHGAARRKRVAGHDVARVQGLLGLIVQRRADSP